MHNGERLRSFAMRAAPDLERRELLQHDKKKHVPSRDEDFWNSFNGLARRQSPKAAVAFPSVAAARTSPNGFSQCARG